MDGSDKDLFPYLPYILQDIWEIGTDPKAIIKLISNHFTKYDNLKVLDLGCGKGAVSVQVASELGCYCYGIDAIPEFIAEAKTKSKLYQVGPICKFDIGDIRIRINDLPKYDIIILGAIGPVFGNYLETLTTLSKCLKKSGIIIIDDGYIEDNSKYNPPLIFKKQEILEQIDRAGMQLIEESVFQSDRIKDSNNYLFENLKKRCNELIEQQPNKKQLFLDYIKKQEDENDVLENKIVCSILVIKWK